MKIAVTHPDESARRHWVRALAARLPEARVADWPAPEAHGADFAVVWKPPAGFFAAHPAIRRPLELLVDVGLGYLRLGQASPTLSGGEAQRIKLVTELARVRPDDGRRGTSQGQSLYLLDEPTVGLHMADVEKLIEVLHRLVDGGNTVLVIEHNLDVLAEADWLIDLGPEGGAAGGRIVAAGTPEQVARVRGSHTGAALAPFLRERGSSVKRRRGKA